MTRSSRRDGQCRLGIWYTLIAWLFLMGIVGWSGRVMAAEQTLELQVGVAHLVKLKDVATKVFVADPEIADVQLASSRTAFINARKVGRTTFVALDAHDKVLAQIDVHIRHDTNAIEAEIKKMFPDYQITIGSATGRIIISGTVKTPKDADAILQIVRGGLVGDKDDLVNHMIVTAATQVNLRVRIAEVKKTIVRQLGIRWDNLLQPAGSFNFGVVSGGSSVFPTPPGLGSYLTGAYQLSTLLEALNTEGLAKTLAEPNLTTVSGEAASFLAGGEVPLITFDVNQNAQVTLKQVGVLLGFVPTVLSADRISLRVKPEVSAIDTTRSVTYAGGTIPGFSVRRVETTVELGSGETFAIGGLLQHDSVETIKRLPALGDIPILGKLFSSRDFQSDETELIILVTPYVVKPTSQTRTAPDTDLNRPSDLERLLLKRLTWNNHKAGSAHAAPPPNFHLHGDAGFLY